MRITSDTARAAIENALNAPDLNGLRDHITTLQVTDLPGVNLWHYDAATRTLTLSATLFEDDAVPLCQTDEIVQAAQREAALASTLRAVAASLA